MSLPALHSSAGAPPPAANHPQDAAAKSSGGEAFSAIVNAFSGEPAQAERAGFVEQERAGGNEQAVGARRGVEVAQFPIARFGFGRAGSGRTSDRQGNSASRPPIPPVRRSERLTTRTPPRGRWVQLSPREFRWAARSGARRPTSQVRRSRAPRPGRPPPRSPAPAGLASHRALPRSLRRRRSRPRRFSPMPARWRLRRRLQRR